MKDLPVILICYSRPQHTSVVLRALQQHNVQNLIIFSDAAKTDKEVEGVLKTRQLIEGIKWTKPEIVYQKENQGLAKSIVSAVNYVFEKNDRLILLEDDCVPQKFFFDYMEKCLTKYENNEKIFGINGYTVPIPAELLKSYPFDIYFYPRMGSWGWATWKRAWKYYDPDLEKLYGEALQKNIDLTQGGADIPAQVQRLLRGELRDVWTLNWVLIVYLNNGFYIYPTASHIDNIGLDGTGVHCGKSNDIPVIADKSPENFPDNIVTNEDLINNYNHYFGGPIRQQKKPDFYFTSTVSEDRPFEVSQTITTKKNAKNKNSKQITIFAVPKAFKEHIALIQRNAIRSWILLDPRPEIILFGNEEGTAKIAREFSLQHIPEIECNELGTPLLDFIFNQAQMLSTNEILTYINSDIILLNNFLPAVRQVSQRLPSFLMVGQRWDVNIEFPINFLETGWEDKLVSFAKATGKLEPPDGIDYFVFRRGALRSMPPFAIGRPRWDNWMIFHALKQQIPVIDATEVALVLHQNHGYQHMRGGKNAAWTGIEAQHNRALAINMDYVRTIEHATWRLTRSGLVELSLRERIFNLSRQGSEYIKAGNFAEALLIFDEILSMDQNTLDIQCARAIALLQFGRLDEAIAAVKIELALQPNHEIARRILSDLYRIQQEQEVTRDISGTHHKNQPAVRQMANEQDNPLSIVQICTVDISGGAAKVAWRLSEAQRNAGHDSKMLVGRKHSTSEHSLSFPLEIDPFIQAKCIQQGLLDYEFQGSHRLVKHHLVRAADILHFHNLHGSYFNPFSILLLSRLKPVVWTLHDMQSFTGHCAHSFDCKKWKTGCGSCPDLSVYPAISIDSTAQLWKDKKLIYDHSSFCLVMPSLWLKNKVQRSILRNHRIELIYNGVDTGIFKPYSKKEFRRKFNLPENTIIIGCVADAGVLSNPWKGGVYTLKAMEALREQMPGCIFLNIGASVDIDIPNVINIPWIQNESELAMLYSVLDIFLFTSLAENCPLVVLEALACGVPVVTFATGGVPELVRDGLEGFVVKYKDAASLIKALIKLAKDPNIRKKISVNARERAISTFDHKITAQKYEDLYMNLISEWEQKPGKSIIKELPLSEVPEIIKTEAFISMQNELESLKGSKDFNKSGEVAQSSDSAFVYADLSNTILVAANLVPFKDQGQLERQQACIQSISELISTDIVPLNICYPDEMLQPQGWHVAPVLKRSANIELRVEGKRKPFVTDLFDIASEWARNNGIKWFALSNSDIIFTTLLIDEVRKLLKEGYETIAISRNDVESVDQSARTMHSRLEVRGYDVFVCQTDWWINNRHLFQPYIFGERAWDNAFAAVMACHSKFHIMYSHSLCFHFKHPTGWYTGPYADYNMSLYNGPDKNYSDKYIAFVMDVLDIMVKAKKTTLSFEETEALIRKYFKPQFKVSAIVSTYNSERFMQGCLEDLVNQTLYKKVQLEIIVIDSGSQQNEKAVVDKFHENFNNIIYLRTTRESVYAAWNRGIKLASGEYIANANTDDRHRNDALEVMANELDRNREVALVYGDQIITKTENETFDSCSPVAYFKWPEFDRKCLLHIACVGPQPMWRKSLHDEFGYFREDLKVAGDYEWWLRISEKYPFRHIPELLGLYLVNERGLEYAQQGSSQKESSAVRESYMKKAGIKPEFELYPRNFIVSQYESTSMEKEPLVSVIIPTHDRPAMLKEAIQSVLQQTYRNFEIIVVNDGGADVSNIINEMNKDDNIIYIRIPKTKGVAASRNTGIRTAQGKYIAYLDDDDIFYPEHLKTLVDFLESGKCKIAYTDTLEAIQGKQQGHYVTVGGNNLNLPDFDYDVILVRNFIPTLCIMHEKSCIDEVGFFDESLGTHEDWDLWIRMSRKFQFGHIRKITSEFRTRQDASQARTSKLEDFHRTRQIIFKRYKDLLKDKTNLLEAQRRILDEEILSMKLEQSKESVSVIIVTFNSAPTLHTCIKSVLQYTREAEVIVVDNASVDETRTILNEYKNRITAILNDKNTGFSYACNQGIKASRGEYVILLNPDTVVSPYWAERMIAHFTPGVGAVGPVSNYVAALQKLDLYYKEPIQGEIRINELAQKLYEWNQGQGRETKLLMGFCMTFPRRVLDEVGLMDEDLFLGNDDLEISWRLRQRGYKLIIATDTFVYHEGQVSFKSQKTSTSDLTKQSTERLYAKLEAYYGAGNVPPPMELWGIDFFKPEKAQFRSELPPADNQLSSFEKWWQEIKQSVHSRSSTQLGRELPVQIDNTWLARDLNIRRDHGSGRIEINGVQGELGLEDVHYLFDKIRALPDGGVIVEIGSFMGLSTIVMAHGLIADGNYNTRIYCVDTWEGSPEHQNLEVIKNKQLYDIFISNIVSSGVKPLIYPIRKRSTEASQDFQEQSIDLLFIDGDHSFESCYEDLKAWYPKLKPESILIGHDCVPGGGVRQALEKFSKEHGFQYSIIEPPAAHYMFELYTGAQMHKQRQPTFAAVYCVYDDITWLKESLESIYSECDAIYFLIGEKPWYGEATENSSTLELIKKFPDPEGKIKIVNGKWTNETEQRNAGLDILQKAGFTYCFVVDSDEVYDPAELWRMKEFVMGHPGTDCWHMTWDTYWKSFRYKIDPREPFTPVVFVKVGEARFIQNRAVGGKNHGLIPPETGICHHLSYARSNGEVLRKITTFSHAHEVKPGWFENVWKKWDFDHSLTTLHPTDPPCYQRAIEQRYSTLPPVLKRLYLADTEGTSSLTQGLTSIIILAYNQWEQTELCLNSIFKHTPEPHEIIIVDNGSTDGTTEHLRELMKARPNIRVIVNATNRGFAAGNNQGMSIAKGDYILLLNNDTIVTEGWLGRMLRVFRKFPQTGIVGPMSNHVVGSQLVPNVDYKNIDEIDAFAARWSREHEGQSSPVYRVIGFCLLAKREVIDRIGGLDEQFGSGNFEDDDFCLRAAFSGYEARIVEDAFIHHTGGQTFKSAGIDYNKSLLRNWDLFKTKWGMPVGSPYEKEYRVPAKLPPGMILYVPLPDLSFDHQVDTEKRWLEEPGEKLQPKERTLGLTSLVILTHNRQEHIRKCMSSIKKHTKEPHEIIFVPVDCSNSTMKWLRKRVRENLNYRLIEGDTHSPSEKVIPPTPPLVKGGGNSEIHPSIPTLAKGGDNFEIPSPTPPLEKGDKGGFESRGKWNYVKAVNRGIAESSGEYIVFLHDDLVVTEEWLTGMLECLNSSPDTGIVGPTAANVEGIQGNIKIDYSSLEHLDDFADSFRQRNKYRRVVYMKPKDFCVLFRSKLVEEIGLFDERFNSYSFAEEDYCLRAMIESNRNVIAADVFIHHGSSCAENETANAVAKDKKTFFRKWGGMDEKSSTGKKLFASNALAEAYELNQKGQRNDAVTMLFESLKRSPDYRRLYYALAEILIENKKFKDAIELLEKMPEGLERDSRGLEYIGYCKEGLELREEADNYADRALALNKTSAKAWNLKGVIAFNRGLNSDAEQSFRKAFESDRGFGEAYANLGAVYWSAKKAEEAFNLFEKAAILSPTIEDVVVNYHTAAVSLSHLERAEKVLQDAVGLYPLNRRLRFILIDILLQRKKYREAMEVMEDTIIKVGTDDDILSFALALREKVGPKSIATLGDKVETRRDSQSHSLNESPSLNKSQVSISLCMIVKNEEKNMVQCLAGIKPVVDEMIVVDTGSADKTKDIAKALGAKVYDFKWTNNFAEARNFSLSKASGKWILVLDADELISPSDFDALRKLIEVETHGDKMETHRDSNLQSPISRPVAYSFVTRNYVSEVTITGWMPNDGKYKEEAGAGWMPSDKVRLFPNDGRARFVNAVHELVEHSLIAAGFEIRPSKIPIHHYGKLSKDKITSKGEEYYQLGKKKAAEQGETDIKALYELGVQASELKKHDEALEFFRKVIALKPDVPTAFYGMGNNYFHLGRYEDALASLKKSLELDPDSRDTVTLYSECEICAGDVQAAIVQLEAYLRKDPVYPMAMLPLATAYFCAGEKEKGIEYVRKLEEINFNGSNYFTGLAKILISNGRLECACSLLEAAIEVKHASSETHSLFEECKKKDKLEIRDSIETHGDSSLQSQVSISLCMIVKNEESNIERCLTNISPLVDEMIVVDTGSTDRTKDIAQKLGAKVYDFKWTDSFADARNFSLSKASGKWILVLDADEVIASSDFDALKKLIKVETHRDKVETHGDSSLRSPVSNLQSPVSAPLAYSLVTRNYVIPQNTSGWVANDRHYSEEAGTGWFLTEKVRLFPNDRRVRFENPVHELVEFSLARSGIEIRKCSIPIHHYGTLDRDRLVSKGEEYYQLGKRKLAEKDGPDVIALYELAVQAGVLEKYEEAIDYWQKIIQLEQNPSESGFGLKEGKKFLGKGISLDTGQLFGQAFYGMANAYFYLNRYEEALASIRRALEINPSSRDVVLLYSKCELCAGNAEASIGILDTLLRKEPDYPRALLELAIAYLCAGRKEKGLEYLKRLKDIHFDNYAEYFSEFARVLISADRFDYARFLLEAAAESNNANSETSALLEECRQKLKNSKQAEVKVEEIATTPELPGSRNDMKESPISSLQSQVSLSLCMIVKNEENNIKRCLSSIKPLVDEMIVVDTGSTDKTKDIAQALGAKVYDFKWTDSFADARNFSLSKASGKWILILDADEVIASSDFGKLKELVHLPQSPISNLQSPISRPMAYSFVTRNYVSQVKVGITSNDGKYREEAGAGWIPGEKVRLFPNDERFRFENPVHELVEPSLSKYGIEVRKSNVPVHHYGKLNEEKRAFKGKEYYNLGKIKLTKKGKKDTVALYELASQAAEIGRYDEAIEHWKKLISVDPDFSLAFLGLGTAYFALGRYNEAIPSLKKALRLDPASKDAMVMCSTSEICTGNAEAAIPRLEALLKRDSRHQLAMFTLMVASFCAGKKEKGLEYEKRLKEMNFPYPDYIINFAKLLIHTKQIAYAVSLLESARKGTDGDSEIAALLSLCYRMLQEAPDNKTVDIVKDSKGVSPFFKGG